MNKKLFRLSLILALLASLGWVTMFQATAPAAADAETEVFEAYNIVCPPIVSQRMWVSEDGILHIRNRVLNSVVHSDSIYHAGIGKIISNANIDLATMYGEYHGNLEIYPAAFPGSGWAGSFVVEITPAGQNGHARLQGYGPALEGWSIKAELIYLPPAVLAGFKDLCGGIQPLAGTRSNGYILKPGQ